MQNVFEVPQTEVPQKKPRKKRVLTPSQKKAFVDRMRKSREERKSKKALETPKQPTTESNNIQTEISQAVEAPPKKVIKKSIEQPSQSNIKFDYSQFDNLTNNIKMLNETLYNLSRPAPPAPPSTPEPIQKVKIIDEEVPKNIQKPIPKQEVKIPIAPQPTIPEKKKVWNCRRKCFVYM